MIGNELRKRYVEDLEGSFISTLYNITQPFIQTSWNDTAILSAQAMMLGIYPPGQNNYKITPDQKYHAVPPLEGFDFKPWIDEMGDEALPFQTTIFPIQMNGWSYDYMLALDDVNCPARATQRATVAANVQSAKDAAKTAYPAMDTYINTFGFDQVCDYVRWAVTESITLKTTVTTAADPTTMHTTCMNSLKNVNTIYNNLEGNSLNKVSSHGVREAIMNYIYQWLATLPTTSADQKKELAAKMTKKVSATAGSENSNYVLYWTNEQLLSLFGLSISSNEVDVTYPLTPSSTIILEFVMDAQSVLQVSGFINDQSVALINCNNQVSCTAQEFADSIKASLASIPDVATYCNA